MRAKLQGKRVAVTDVLFKSTVNVMAVTLSWTLSTVYYYVRRVLKQSAVYHMLFQAIISPLRSLSRLGVLGKV